MDQNKGSDEMMWVGFMILLAIIVFGLWYFARAVVVWIIFAPDLVQIYALSLIYNFNEGSQAAFEYVKSMFDGRGDPSTVEWQTITTISSMVGNSTRYAISGIILAMAIYVVFYMKGSGFARSFSLVGGKNKGPSLAHYQTKEWGVAITSAHFDPNQTSEEEGPALTPLLWMKEHDVSLTESEGLDRRSAEVAFEAQLGEPWQGLDAAPMHVQALFILCILNARRDKKRDQIKGEIAHIWTLKPKEAEKLTKALIAPYKKDPEILKEIEKRTSRHAFITTALYRTLIWARKTGGIFACAEFRWLKAVDRNLWYALQNAGRRAYFIEGSGVVAHYQVEFLTAKATAAPKVSTAVDGLEDFLRVHHITNLDRMFKKDDD